MQPIWGKGEYMITIKITLGSRRFIKDLAIFRDFRLLSGSPFRRMSDDNNKKWKQRQNQRYRKLLRIRVPTDDEKEKMETLIYQAWEEYINLYEKGFKRRRRIKKFRCRVMDEYDHFGLDPRAVYVEVHRGKAKAV